MGVFLRRLGRLAAMLAVLLAAPICAAAAEAVHRIVAVGDLHGDFAAWRAIAMAAGVVDARGRWAGQTTVLVQTGDAVDRGPDSLKIVQDLIRLQREAARAKGQVVALVGNHEAMNVTGDLRYVSAADFAAYATPRSAEVREKTYEANRETIEAAYRQRDPAMTPEAVKQAWFAATPPGWLEHQAAWRPDGPIGKWVISNPAVAMLDGVIFLHGGISPAYAGVAIADINRRVAEALAMATTAPDAIINDPDGPLWYRGLTADAAAGPPAVPAPGATPAPDAAATPAPPPSPQAQVEQALMAYGARAMVVGHTPILSGVVILYGGRLARIDTGISSVFGGKLTWLEILDGKLVAHEVARPPPGKEGA
jgi:hypothetical protein